MIKGIVTKSTGSWYEVELENQEIITARIKGKFRLKGLKLTNPIAVGDRVLLDIEEQSLDYVIKDIEERENYVIRQSPRKKHHLHILASNVDQAILLVTVVQPKLKQSFIDRFLMMTEPYNIPVTIIFNKADLYAEKDLETFQYFKEIYATIGYNCILTSAVSSLNLEEVKKVLKDKTSLVSGQSGVGKSTLINSIEPKLDLKTNYLSNFSGKGQHTTTFAEMHRLSFGGKIIDTPGIKSLSFNHYTVMDIAHNFSEIFTHSKACKYANCTHRNEPKCAIKELVESEEISDLRYMNYLTLVEEVEDQNYWERNQDY